MRNANGKTVVCCAAAVIFFASGCLKADDPLAPGTAGAWHLVHERHNTLYYHGIFFSDLNNGWVVGDEGVVLHTGDGGITWTVQESGTTDALQCVYFANAQQGWIGGGNNSIGITTDGGRSWTWQHPAGKTRRMFMGLSFVNASTGWAVDNNRGIHRTDDSGSTWTTQVSTATSAVTGVHFFDANEGWAVTVNREALHTTDGGGTWISRDLADLNYGSNVSAIFSDVFFFDRSHGWIATNVGSSSISSPLASVVTTMTSGAAWECQPTPEGLSINAVRFVSPSVGWAAGSGGILVSTNGGAAWSYELQNADAGPFIDIFFVDRSHGWALTFTGRIYAYTISSQ